MNLALLAVTVLPFVITPGASFTITITAALNVDKRAPVKVWAGTALGICLIAAIAGFSGLGQLVTDSEAARTSFGIIGGLVLVAIGVASLVKLTRAEETAAQNPRPASRLWLWAFLVVVTNVKALSLYVLVVPTIHNAGIDGPMLFAAFAATHVTMLFVWLTFIGLVVGSTPGFLKSSRTRAALLLITALTLIGLGLWTGIEAALPDLSAPRR